MFALGFEGAGYPNPDDVTLLNLLPRIVDAIQIPVIACGGIADRRQFLAALSMGAEGVMMGTRFMLTKESPVHPNAKKALVEANETDTVIIQRSLGTQSPAFRNRTAQRILEMESKGTSRDELRAVMGGSRSNALLDGDIEGGGLGCGQGIGLIDGTPSVKEVIDDMTNGAMARLKDMGPRWQL